MQDPEIRGLQNLWRLRMAWHLLGIHDEYYARPFRELLMISVLEFMANPNFWSFWERN